MAGAQSIQTCRWGSPTLFLPWPYWSLASDNEWSCTRGEAPRGIDDPRLCATCRYWAVAMAAGAQRHGDDHLGSTAP
jgi:hypothetical protein